MHFQYPLLSGFLLLTAAVASRAQTAPVAEPVAASVPEAPQRLLLKVGLNAGRAVRYGGYAGLTARLPVAVGAEYALNPKFTVYGQFDSDFRLARQSPYFGDQNFLVPAGALGVGVRYYYSQADRARQNRPHGSFVGNYLALEAHTELRQRYGLRPDVAPGLNLVWGMQRRLSRNFLFDFNAGAGLAPYRSDSNIGYSSGVPSALNITTQLNLGVYFGH